MDPLALRGTQADIVPFRVHLIEWGRTHFRNFPWRSNRNPYNLLIAEILLHRTQAKQVVDIYIDFINHYPDPQALSKAVPEELNALVQPLGLFWRSSLIRELADDLINRFQGAVPQTKKDLLSLPGVGDYIASSVLCFAYGRPEAIIDTNVMRVVTRVFGIPFRDSLRRNRRFKEFVQSLIDTKNPRSYNFAILDLANLVCLPKRPKCETCPLRILCNYWYDKNTASFT